MKMKYFKDKDNNIFAYAADGSDDEIIPDELVAIDEKTALLLANPPPTREELIATAENVRQQLLADADAAMLDWRTELMLGEISDANREKLSEWLAYKNEVKSVDVTIDPEHVNWPELPG